MTRPARRRRCAFEDTNLFWRTTFLASALLPLLLVALAPQRSLGRDYLRLTGRIVDDADLLSPEVESELSRVLDAHEERTTNQVVVVTVRSLEGRTIDDYTLGLANHWGVGRADRDNGVVFLVAPNDRQVRIEGGYGLEDPLTNARAKCILEEFVLPRFRAGQMADGIEAGVARILVDAGEWRRVPDEDVLRPTRDRRLGVAASA